MNCISATHTPSGFPYPGGPARQLTIYEIAAIGKLHAYGDSVVRFVLRTHAGDLFFLKASDQDAADRRWLAAAARTVPRFGERLSRDTDWHISWLELARK